MAQEILCIVPISIHSLYTEGDSETDNMIAVTKISIHSLYTEGDVQPRAKELSDRTFQSTPSIQRETHCVSSLLIF